MFFLQKEHFFKYRISPFTSYYDAEQKAIELQFTPFAIQETFHKGKLPSNFGGINVLASNLSVTAIKQHRLGDGIVIRIFENEGKDTNTSILLFGMSFNVYLPHNSVKTFLIKDKSISEIDFVE